MRVDPVSGSVSLDSTTLSAIKALYVPVAGFEPKVDPARFDASTDAAKARNAALLGADKPYGHEDANEAFDLAPGGLATIKAYLEEFWPKQADAAARMLPAPEAGMGTLRVAYFYYGSGRPMEAWIDALPADKKLKLRFPISVSWHDGNGLAYAKDNEYQGEMKGPTGRIVIPKFGPGVSGKPETTSVSPLVTADVSKPGDYHFIVEPVQGARKGYIEGRELIVHVTGKERVLGAPAGKGYARLGGGEDTLVR